MFVPHCCSVIEHLTSGEMLYRRIYRLKGVQVTRYNLLVIFKASTCRAEFDSIQFFLFIFLRTKGGFKLLSAWLVLHAPAGSVVSCPVVVAYKHA